MQENKEVECAKKLVNKTIENYKKKLLGKESMSHFLKKNLNKDVTRDDYDKILHLYCRYLAEEGYEIKRDINHFDIIDYNSREYEYYVNNINIDIFNN